MKHTARILFATLCSLILVPVSGAFAQGFRGPISSSLGGTGIAGLPSAEGALINPALVAIFPGSSVDLTYRDGSLGDGRHRQALAAGAIDDGKDELFSGAVHYVRTRDSGRTRNPVSGELWHAAIGARLSERVAVGAMAYRLVHKVNDGPVGSTTQWNYGLGALYMVTKSFGLGYVIRNLALPGGRVPEGLREDLNHALGGYVGLGEMARLRVDVGRLERHNPDRQLNYAVGLETRTNELVLLRLGFRHDEAGDGRSWSAGIAFDGPRLKLDYALENSLTGQNGALHSVDLRMPF